MIKALKDFSKSRILSGGSVFICILIFLQPDITSQNLSLDTPCGTRPGSNVWLKQHLGQDHSRSIAELIYLPVTFHSVAEDDGTGRYPIVKILESMCRLNADFAPYDIQFYQIGEINEINRSRYYNHDNFGDGDRMMRTFNRHNTINVYITNNAPRNACGYWLDTEDAIVVRKNCMGFSGHTLTHELGHFLALHHPFRGWEGKTYDPDVATPLYHGISGRDTSFIESVSGKNCAKAADLICDTGPDYLSISWECDGSNQSLIKQIDPFGTEFKSDATNFMSYSSDHCQQVFTPDQVDVMHAFAQAEKSTLINTRPAPPVSEASISNMTPSGGQEVAHQSIELSWDEHPNASNYIVQISRFSFFASLENEFIVNSNSVNIGDFPVDKKFYWRVLPYNAYDHCSTFTVAEGGFATVISTQTHDLNGNNSIQIYPTKVHENDPIVYLELDLTSVVELNLRVVNMMGQPLMRKSYRSPGDQTISLSLGEIPAGAYVLQILTNQGNLSQVLIKQ